MKRAVVFMICLSLAGTTLSLFAAGCGSSDNSAEIEKMKTPPPSNNPNVPPVSKSDTDMTEDPKRMKGRGPAGGP